ncbi:uncharacterized protein G2W53_042732 [Senna tora]|uniref:Uncharacterized protein n=1 Tax=Senna tora TaxID=362788 RepID=A0A834SHP8_9FABA|nr:uncharacterized protein G2W53_042732 [Senna tora]
MSSRSSLHKVSSEEAIAEAAEQQFSIPEMADLRTWQASQSLELSSMYSSSHFPPTGPVGCNHGCFLQSGGDDWESAVFIVKRAGWYPGNKEWKEKREKKEEVPYRDKS